MIEDWIDHLKRLNIDFVINAYNDGSTDQSLELLRELQPKHPELNVIDKPNSGHGPTILKGYRESNSKWIFQVDSDNEISAKYFIKLWDKRKSYDLLIGRRKNRNQNIIRKFISFISRITIHILYERKVYDVNSPYRLMRKIKFEKIFKYLPDNIFAPNIIISGVAPKVGHRIFEKQLPVRSRETGENSLKNCNLLKASFQSWFQTIIISCNYKQI